MNELVELWRARNERERWIIGIAGTLIIVFLLDSLLVQPLLKSRERLRRGLPELRIASTQVKNQSALAAQLKARAGVNALQNTDLNQAISQTAAAAGISDKLSEVRGTDANRVNVTLENVSFDAWINWLTQLQMQYGAKLESGQLEALPESGMIKVRAVLATKK